MTIETSFEAFYEAVNDRRPFPWQTRLANHVCDTGTYPSLLDIPTGLGKTSLLEIAVWIAAKTGCAPGTAGRRRTFFIIDRRVVVDEAFEQAQRIAAALGTTSGAAAEVGAALRALSGANDADPLVVERMRGGITWNWRWLDRPDRAAIVVGTVDQLGSRFLFRGYGLRGELAPIDAALVGTDSVIIVDEAHLSRPLVDTITEIAGSEELDATRLRPRPTVVSMSATGGPREASFTIDDADRLHPVAGQRLRSAKSIHLFEVEGSPTVRAGRTVSAMAAQAVALSSGGAQAVGVVCNTVGRGRSVFDAVRHLTQDKASDIEVRMITGRVRPWDREHIKQEIWPLACVGRVRAEYPQAIIVATQTIEVGANLDFDALVTESASWDALVQRLGRLNRLGELDESHAVIVHDGLDSPIYGEPRLRTWAMLAGKVEPARYGGKPVALSDPIAAGPSVLAEALGEASLDLLCLEPEKRPVLLRSHLDVWTQTSPRPRTDIPIAPFLHGYQRPSEEVRLVWRSDLEDLGGTQRLEVLAAIPPRPEEELAVPIGAARRWLQGSDPVGANDISDLVGRPEVDDDLDAEPDATAQLEAVRFPTTDAGSAELVLLPEQANRLRPDDLLVLPASAGGCDRYGWSPESTSPVSDLADVTASRPMLRVWPERTLRQTLRLIGTSVSDDKIAAVAAATSTSLDEEDPSLLVDAADALLRSLGRNAQEALRTIPLAVDDETSRLIARMSFIDRKGGGPIVAVLKPAHKVSTGADLQASSDSQSNPIASSYSDGTVTLAIHLDAVATRARTIASSLRLSTELAEAVELAAAWHDVGKLDRRFQVMLHGGDDLAADSAAGLGEPLAKSDMDPADRAIWRRAFRESKLPRGFRHEVASAAAVDIACEGLELDRDLVRHLVASHHGRGRPLFPAVDDPGDAWTLEWSNVAIEHNPADAIDWTSASRFDRLNDRYGRWGLALLESIVRLADIGCSEEGT